MSRRQRQPVNWDEPQQARAAYGRLRRAMVASIAISCLLALYAVLVLPTAIAVALVALAVWQIAVGVWLIRRVRRRRDAALAQFPEIGP